MNTIQESTFCRFTKNSSALILAATLQMGLAVSADSPEDRPALPPQHTAIVRTAPVERPDYVTPYSHHAAQRERTDILIANTNPARSARISITPAGATYAAQFDILPGNTISFDADRELGLGDVDSVLTYKLEDRMRPEDVIITARTTRDGPDHTRVGATHSTLTIDDMVEAPQLLYPYGQYFTFPAPLGFGNPREEREDLLLYSPTGATVQLGAAAEGWGILLGDEVHVAPGQVVRLADRMRDDSYGDMTGTPDAILSYPTLFGFGSTTGQLYLFTEIKRENGDSFGDHFRKIAAQDPITDYLAPDGKYPSPANNGLVTESYLPFHDDSMNAQTWISVNEPGGFRGDFSGMSVHYHPTLGPSAQNPKQWWLEIGRSFGFWDLIRELRVPAANNSWNEMQRGTNGWLAVLSAGMHTSAHVQRTTPIGTTAETQPIVYSKDLVIPGMTGILSTTSQYGVDTTIHAYMMSGNVPYPDGIPFNVRVYNERNQLLVNTTLQLPPDRATSINLSEIADRRDVRYQRGRVELTSPGLFYAASERLDAAHGVDYILEKARVVHR